MDPRPLEGPNTANWSLKKRECTTNDFHSLIQHSEAWFLVLFFHPQLIWVKRKKEKLAVIIVDKHER